MAKSGGGATGGSSTERQKAAQSITALFGTLTKKRKGTTETRKYFLQVSKRAAEALNIQELTEEEASYEKNGKLISPLGEKGGKFILVPDPVGKKTEGGKGVTKYQIPVPASANIKEIRSWLVNTKAERFSIKGGRMRNVGKAKAN
jgi:hypothetical protein